MPFVILRSTKYLICWGSRNPVLRKCPVDPSLWLNHLITTPRKVYSFEYIFQLNNIQTYQTLFKIQLSRKYCCLKMLKLYSKLNGLGFGTYQIRFRIIIEIKRFISRWIANYRFSSLTNITRKCLCFRPLVLESLI